MTDRKLLSSYERLKAENELLKKQIALTLKFARQVSASNLRLATDNEFLRGVKHDPNWLRDMLAAQPKWED